MKNLRNLRLKLGVSLKELGSVFGLAESTISLYETGKRQPDNETLIKLADYFDVSTDYLLGRSEQKNKAHPSEKDGHAIIRYDSDKLNELMAVIAALPESEQEKLLDFAKYQAARLDKPTDT